MKYDKTATEQIKKQLDSDFDKWLTDFTSWPSSDKKWPEPSNIYPDTSGPWTSPYTHDPSRTSASIEEQLRQTLRIVNAKVHELSNHMATLAHKFDEAVEEITEYKRELELESRWSELKELGEKYRALREEIKEKDETWQALNK